MISVRWLDVAPRRRLAIPSQDLAVGITGGLVLCLVALVLATSVGSGPPQPEPPLRVSIGVMERTPSGGAGGGVADGPSTPGTEATQTLEQGPPIEAPTFVDPTASPAPEQPSPSPLPRRRTHRRVAGPVPMLPGLGDLEGPAEPPGGGGAGSGGGGPGDGSGDGNGSGSGGGTGDGALAAYRSQLAAWLSSRFHVTGSGLSPSALRALRVRAVLELSEDRVVVDFSLEPTGTAAIDDAARAALESVRGQPAPEPPAGYGAVQSRIRVTFRCRPNTCS
ncbi:hypothetical protein [Paraliomyxa miuraensis]|uniref:hypothetical protein n=1 Tax=Paraliomyxa miuraensis TaxID=376150 RepID=UPI00225A74C1|nr:hypothetical protein [Paraliomyxa miuraensis]MCX4244078.1 hypothetical protein [Paraliomyxa miuraensis]